MCLLYHFGRFIGGYLTPFFVVRSYFDTLAAGGVSLASLLLRLASSWLRCAGGRWRFLSLRSHFDTLAAGGVFSEFARSSIKFLPALALVVGDGCRA